MMAQAAARRTLLRAVGTCATVPADAAVPHVAESEATPPQSRVRQITAALIEAGVDPRCLDHGGIATELTNHLRPGVVATIPEPQHAGFLYAS